MKDGQEQSAPSSIALIEDQPSNHSEVAQFLSDPAQGEARAFPATLVSESNDTGNTQVLTSDVKILILLMLGARDLQSMMLVSKYWHYHAMLSLFRPGRENAIALQSLRSCVLDFHLSQGAFPYLEVSDEALRLIAQKPKNSCTVSILALGALTKLSDNDLLALQAFSCSPNIEDTARTLFSLCSKPIVDPQIIAGLNQLGNKLIQDLQGSEIERTQAAELLRLLAKRLVPSYRSAVLTSLVNSSLNCTATGKAEAAAIKTLSQLLPDLSHNEIRALVNHYLNVVTRMACIWEFTNILTLIHSLLPHFNAQENILLIDILKAVLSIEDSDTNDFSLNPLYTAGTQLITKLTPSIGPEECHIFAELLAPLAMGKTSANFHDALIEAFDGLVQKLTEDQREKVCTWLLRRNMWPQSLPKVPLDLLEASADLFSAWGVRYFIPPSEHSDQNPQDTPLFIVAKIFPHLNAIQREAVFRILQYTLSEGLLEERCKPLKMFNPSVIQHIVPQLNDEQIQDLLITVLQHHNRREIQRDEIEITGDFISAMLPRLNVKQLERCLTSMIREEVLRDLSLEVYHNYYCKFVNSNPSKEFLTLKDFLSDTLNYSLGCQESFIEKWIEYMSQLLPLIKADYFKIVQEFCEDMLSFSMLPNNLFFLRVIATKGRFIISPESTKKMLNKLVVIIKDDETSSARLQEAIRVFSALVDNSFDRDQLEELIDLCITRGSGEHLSFDVLYSTLELMYKTLLPGDIGEKFYSLLTKSCSWFDKKNDFFIRTITEIISTLAHRFSPKQRYQMCDILVCVDSNCPDRIVALTLAMTPEEMTRFIDLLLIYSEPCHSKSIERLRQFLSIITHIIPRIPADRLERCKSLLTTNLDIFYETADSHIEEQTSLAQGVFCLNQSQLSKTERSTISTNISLTQVSDPERKNQRKLIPQCFFKLQKRPEESPTLDIPSIEEAFDLKASEGIGSYV